MVAQKSRCPPQSAQGGKPPRRDFKSCYPTRNINGVTLTAMLGVTSPQDSGAGAGEDEDEDESSTSGPDSPRMTPPRHTPTLTYLQGRWERVLHQGRGGCQTRTHFLRREGGWEVCRRVLVLWIRMSPGSASEDQTV